MPAGNIVVQGNLTVAAGALLDATTPGDPVANPLLPANLTVRGNVTVGAGAVLLVGCSPFIFCPQAATADTIGGSLIANQALGVLVHSVSVGGDVSVVGGGGGATCGTPPALWLSDPSLANGEGPGTPLPVYSDFEDVTIGGNLRIFGLQSCWLGALRDQVAGSAAFTGNTMGDPDAMEIESDVVGGHMTCEGNIPAAQYGDGNGAPTVVAGAAFGQCAFSRQVPNPKGGGTLEPLTVSASSLSTSTGTHVVASSQGAVFGVTRSGVQVTGARNRVTLAGGGLTGPVKESVLADQYPDGRQTFYAVDQCTCSFGGHTGTVTILAEGTTTAGGLTTGTFSAMSGGAGDGGLANLVVMGTFTSAGQPSGTLLLNEHLGLT